MQTRAIFPAALDSLSRINDFVTAAAESAGFAPQAVYAVQMAVEEACSNIIEYAYAGDVAGDIACTCAVDDAGLTITLCDHGRSFDPAVVPEPDLSCSLEDRQVGGLGLYLMHQMMDEVHFECQAGVCNLLTLVKYKQT